MTKETGGPAFPSPYSNVENQGLTMRDYFAAKAIPLCGPVQGHHPSDLLRLGQLAYWIADAMLEARK